MRDVDPLDLVETIREGLLVLETDIDSALLPTDRALPIGPIVNELVIASPNSRQLEPNDGERPAMSDGEPKPKDSAAWREVREMLAEFNANEADLLNAAGGLQSALRSHGRSNVFLLHPLRGISCFAYPGIARGRWRRDYNPLTD
jgi:hypothetical protein